MKTPTTNRAKTLLALLLSVGLLAACAGQQNNVSTADREAVAAMSKAGKAYFEEKCKTVAGEKIYRTVPDVEGLVLLKVRPERSQTQLEDPMWPGAAFASESREDQYIKNFLGYERLPSNGDGSKGVISKERRGQIVPDKKLGDLPGYRYVDVIDAKDGQRYRYTVRIDQPWLRDKRYGEWVREFVLDKAHTTTPAPRYGVTYEDHVIPQERAIGVASSTVKVIDLTTNEVIGEMTRYAFRPRGIRQTEWLTSAECPAYPVDSSSSTRKFVDQVLKPKGE
jgi:hypothetical protein